MSASYTFFAIQVAIKNFFKDPLRSRLHSLIQSGADNQTLFEKRRFWKELVAVVNEARPVFEMGTWELIRGDRASEEFESWSAEIEGSLATEPAEHGAAADEVNRLSSEASYVLVTALFLVDQGSNADQTLGERCELEESVWFTRATFAHLFATIPLLNFTNVQADAVYLVPGSDRDGLSDADLHGGDYEHLRPLTA